MHFQDPPIATRELTHRSPGGRPRRPLSAAVMALVSSALVGAHVAPAPAWAQTSDSAPIVVRVDPTLAAATRGVLAAASRDGIATVLVPSSPATGQADLAVTHRGVRDGTGAQQATGRSVWVPVTHFACPVGSIPLARLRAVMSGRSTSWASFGGPRRRVIPVIFAPGGKPDPMALAALRMQRVRKVRLVRTAAQAVRLAATRPGVLALVPISSVNVRVRTLAVSGRQALDLGGRAPYPVAIDAVVERVRAPATVTPTAAAIPAAPLTRGDTSTPTTSTPTTSTPSTTTPDPVREQHIETLRRRLVSALVRTPVKRKLTIVAVGDVMLSRKVLRAMYATGDWRRPFRRTASILRAGDVTFGNLESPFSDRGGPVLAGMSFKAEPPSIAGLVSSGFDVMSLANNHFGNQGRYGMHYTFRHLNAAGIAYSGAGKDYRAAHTAAVVQRSGQKVAFLSYNEIWPYDYVARRGQAGLAWMESPTQIRKDVAAARRRADLVIVSYHWGVEYTPHPTGRQRSYGRLAIDAGADAVISQHPHVVQAVEWRKGRFIAYSLGNFVFDQMWSQETREGLIAHAYALDGRIVGVTLTPTVIADYNQPRLAGRGLSNRILGRVWRASGVSRW